MKRLLLLMLLLIPFAGCKAGQGDFCLTVEDCASGLLCFEPSEPSRIFTKEATYRTLKPYLDDYTCVTPEDLAEAAQAHLDADCRASRFCRSMGWCTSKDGECQATSDADCKGSNVCLNSGKCTAKNGGCRK